MNIGSVQSINFANDKKNYIASDSKINQFQDKLDEVMESQDKKEIKDACDQMETYMISTIFKQMKASTTLGETLFEKGDYEEMFEDQLIEERAKDMVKAGGMGLSKMMYEQMTQTYTKK
ncbi:MAG: rod-binding protein [Cellulosilyticaceae bacterium]